jgi:PAS domain S-box-containing protein
MIMTQQAVKPKSKDELKKEIQRIEGLLQEEQALRQEAQETLEAIRTGAVDGIVRSTPEGEQIFILKGSDTPYRNLIEKMDEGALLISESGSILYANMGFAKLLDAPFDKVMGTHVSEWVSARNIEVLNDIIAGNLKNGRRVFEIAFQTTKKQLVPTQVSISKISLDSINASALIITDLSKHMQEDVKRYTADLEKEIAERKKAEEALQNSEKQKNDILESITDGFVAFDKEWRYTYINSNAAKILLTPKEELIGKVAIEVFPNASKFLAEFQKAVSSGRPVHFEEFYPEPLNIWYECHCYPSEMGLTVFFSDITQRKKAEEEIKASAEKYRILSSSMDEGYFVIDVIFNEQNQPTDLFYVETNPVSVRIVGSDYTGKRLTEISPNYEKYWFEIFGDVALTGKSVRLERYAEPDNKWYSFYVFKIGGKDSRRVGNTFLDVTERKKAEVALRASEQKLEEYSKNLEKLVEERTKQLKDSERLAAIGVTAGMVGHDIRNPLQAITGDVYLLRDYLSGMPDTISVKHDVAQSLEEIEKNVGYINKIVADLQDYSRAVTPELRNLNLYELVTGAFRNIEIPENVNPTIEIDSKINLKTDATLLTRILTNLVINAIQAMPKGGKLSIVAMQTQDSLVLSVQDTGVGIPEYIKPKLFTPMTTTKAKGQGLGLAVVKRLVEALKGTICFESKEGNGTKFTITLPINR